MLAQFHKFCVKEVLLYDNFLHTYFLYERHLHFVLVVYVWYVYTFLYRQYQHE